MAPCIILDVSALGRVSNIRTGFRIQAPTIEVSGFGFQDSGHSNRGSSSILAWNLCPRPAYIRPTIPAKLPLVPNHESYFIGLSAEPTSCISDNPCILALLVLKPES